MTTASNPAPGMGLTVTLQGDREVVLSRTFDAPRELVFTAISRPEHVARWWGPRRFTTEIVEMDFRVGGRWRFVQRDAESHEFAFSGEYRELAPPERVVQTFVFELFPDSVSVETAVLTEHEGKTTITVTVAYDSPETRAAVVASDMEAGAAESYERLAELVATLA